MTNAPDITALQQRLAQLQQRVRELTGRADTADELAAHSAAFSADGHRILTTSADGTARLWTISDDSSTLAE